MDRAELRVRIGEWLCSCRRRNEVTSATRYCRGEHPQQASEEWGFFQVINHGIPQSLLDEMIDGAHRFHEQDAEVKKQYYSRDLLRMVRYFSNGDLFESSTANWNDCLAIKLTASNQAEPDESPEVCR